MWATNRDDAGAVGYPVVPLEDARLRADGILGVVGLESDVDLEDRLVQLLRAMMPDRAASALARETDHLYFSLHDPARDQEHKPVNTAALHRALTLAMSRPSDDLCWNDYQEVVTAIESRWVKATAEYGPHPLRAIRRRLTRTKPDLSELETSWQAPISAARRHFIATWQDV
jgi:hypothetical protein